MYVTEFMVDSKQDKQHGTGAESTELGSELYFSCSALAKLQLPGFPGSEAGWLKLAKREGLKYRDVRAQGGKGGLRREYVPPEDALRLIEQRIHGEPRSEGHDFSSVGLVVPSMVARGEVTQAPSRVGRRPQSKLPAAPAPEPQGSNKAAAITLILAGTLQAMGDRADAMKAAAKAVEMYQGFAGEDMPRFGSAALGFILAGILEGMGDKGELVDYQRAAGKAVAYYLQAVRQGLITPDGSGTGPGGAQSA